MNTLLKRLEAVALRLEDIVASADTEDIQTVLKSTQALLRPDAFQAASAQAPFETSTLPPDVEEPVPKSIERFDDFVDASVGRYVELSRGLGGLIALQAEHVLDSFREQRKILVAATKTTKLDTPKFQELLRPMNRCVADVVELKERSRGAKEYNHLSCVADGIGLLGWIGLELRPYRHVDEYLTYAQYFGNKVLTEYKKKDTKDVEWAQSFYQVFHDLSSLVKEEFHYGIGWK